MESYAETSQEHPQGPKKVGRRDKMCCAYLQWDTGRAISLLWSRTSSNPSRIPPHNQHKTTRHDVQAKLESQPSWPMHAVQPRGRQWLLGPSVSCSLEVHCMTHNASSMLTEPVHSRTHLGLIGGKLDEAKALEGPSLPVGWQAHRVDLAAALEGLRQCSAHIILAHGAVKALDKDAGATIVSATTAAATCNVDYLGASADGGTAAQGGNVEDA